MRTDAARILIVDDDEPFRALVASLLERAGYATAEASTGEEALTSVRRETPACILLDVLLPRATGYEVCRELRDRYGEALPIVFVTGQRTEPADRVAGLLIGADDYILKPFDPDELIARVRRLLVRSGILAKFAGDKSRNGFQLTDREAEVLRLLADGLEQDRIARELFISPKTVSTHIQRILTKLGVHSRAQAIAVAYRENLVAGAKHADTLVMH
jgi:two-component system, NarL family, nitrate/nitrite response regulator NarL